MTELFNRACERDTRQRLRNSMTTPEVKLWSRLKGGQVFGAKFRRQYSIGPFVVDFCCARQKLVIEVDGDTHHLEGAPEHDANRENYISRFGFCILRFTNRDVMDNIDGVLEAIASTVQRTSGT